MGSAFYSFKGAQIIGGDTYSRSEIRQPSVPSGPSKAVRCVGNRKNCLNTNPTGAIRAVPVGGCAPMPAQYVSSSIIAWGRKQQEPSHAGCKHRNARVRPASPGVRGKGTVHRLSRG